MDIRFQKLINMRHAWRLESGTELTYFQMVSGTFTCTESWELDGVRCLVVECIFEARHIAYFMIGKCR